VFYLEEKIQNDSEPAQGKQRGCWRVLISKLIKKFSKNLDLRGFLNFCLENIFSQNINKINYFIFKEMDQYTIINYQLKSMVK